MILSKRSFLRGLVAAPFVILTPKLLMPVRARVLEPVVQKLKYASPGHAFTWFAGYDTLSAEFAEAAHKGLNGLYLDSATQKLWVKNKGWERL